MSKTAMQIYPYNFNCIILLVWSHFFFGVAFAYLRIDIPLDNLGIIGYIKYLSLRCSNMGTSSSGISCELMLIQLEQCS